MLPSINQIEFLKKRKKKKRKIQIIQFIIILCFFGLWEFLAFKKIINPFIFSSPSRIWKTFLNLLETHNLFPHIWTTLYETLISFVLGLILGFTLAISLYEFSTFAKVIDPFLTMINSLPKVALGPIIIIWAGANMNSIIVMALLINLIVTTISIYNGFLSVDDNKLKLLKSFGATKSQILIKLVIPNSWQTIISTLKLNISMSLIGVIMGEFLVSKQGLGYLIIYGTQIFNLNMVMTGVILLLIISFALYEIIAYIEKKLIKT